MRRVCNVSNTYLIISSVQKAQLFKELSEFTDLRPGKLPVAQTAPVRYSLSFHEIG